MKAARGRAKRERLLIHQRAYAIVLSIYYFEFIKASILDTLNQAYPPDRQSGRKPLTSIQRALSLLVEENVLRPTERNELMDLVRHRNEIAHRVHYIAAGVTPTLLRLGRGALKTDSSTDERLAELRFYADEIEQRLRLRYPTAFTLTPFLFRKARKEYEAEYMRLARMLRDLDLAESKN